ncbi:hypothetical protein [Microbispora sp. NPDC046933]
MSERFGKHSELPPLRRNSRFQMLWIGRRSWERRSPGRPSRC